MSSNRTFANAEAYPAGFLEVITKGSGLLYARDLPWTTVVAAKRFRQCVALIRSSKGHPLSAQAYLRWSVRPTMVALIITGRAKAQAAPSPTGFLLAAALEL